MELSQILNLRRSCRHYLKTPVPKEKLEELISAAIEAPVSCNLQLTQYLILDDHKVLRELGYKASYKFSYSPASILVLYDPRFTAERHSVVSSSGMATENIVLRATDLGLATCPMAGFERDVVIKKILNIPKHLEIMMLIAVGFPDPSFEPMKPFRILPQTAFNYNSYNGLKTLNGSSKLSDYKVPDIIEYRSRISTVYLNRFRLNTFSEKYYDKVFEFFKEEVLFKNNKKKIIDILSYDGVFLRTLNSIMKENSLDLTSSDYLKNNLDFFKDQFNSKSVLIDSKNDFNISNNEKYDVATLVFQAEFTPNLITLLKNIPKILDKDGLLFVANVSESWYKRYLKVLRSIYRVYILRKMSNVYEGNPFYKIGPRVHISNNKIKNMTKDHLSITKQTEIKIGRGNKISIFILKKK